MTKESSGIKPSRPKPTGNGKRSELINWRLEFMSALADELKGGFRDEVQF